MAGLEKARADGKQLGRRRVVVDRSKVWTLRDDGETIRQIAAKLKLSHGTVQRIIEARTTANFSHSSKVPKGTKKF